MMKTISILFVLFLAACTSVPETPKDETKYHKELTTSIAHLVFPRIALLDTDSGKIVQINEGMNVLVPYHDLNLYKPDLLLSIEKGKLLLYPYQGGRLAKRTKPETVLTRDFCTAQEFQTEPVGLNPQDSWVRFGVKDEVCFVTPGNEYGKFGIQRDGDEVKIKMLVWKGVQAKPLPPRPKLPERELRATARELVSGGVYIDSEKVILLDYVIDEAKGTGSFYLFVAPDKEVTAVLDPFVAKNVPKAFDAVEENHCKQQTTGYFKGQHVGLGPVPPVFTCFYTKKGYGKVGIEEAGEDSVRIRIVEWPAR